MQKLIRKLALPSVFAFIVMCAILVHGPLAIHLAILLLGLAAMNSLGSALFGFHVLATGYPHPGSRDAMVGWGLSNLLAPISDTAAGLGQLLQHPSWGNLAQFAESPFRGVGQMFGGHVGIPGQNPQQPAMPQPPGAASYLPAPVPALGPHMGQAFGPGAHAIVSYMGLGVGAFAAAGPNPLLFQPEPQAPFIGNRLVVTSKTNGASTTGIQVTITSPLTVSGIPQTPAPQVPAPIEMFAPDVTYSALQIQIAAAGTAISIAFTASTLPTGTDTLLVSAGLYGYWLK